VDLVLVTQTREDRLSGMMRLTPFHTVTRSFTRHCSWRRCTSWWHWHVGTGVCYIISVCAPHWYRCVLYYLCVCVVCMLLVLLSQCVIVVFALHCASHTPLLDLLIEQLNDLLIQWVRVTEWTKRMLWWPFSFTDHHICSYLVKLSKYWWWWIKFRFDVILLLCVTNV